MPRSSPDAASPDPASPDPASPSPGDPAPGLVLPTIDDEPFDLAHRDHKIALVTFLRHAG